MKERPRREKKFGVFPPGTLKTTFQMRNLTQNDHNQGIFPKLGHLFPIFEKGQGRPPPPPPSSYAPAVVSYNKFLQEVPSKL